MDAPLKQRLIGAAVLVALAVIFLPMLVDGPEPPSATSDVPIEIPTAPARDFETRELPLDLPAPAPAPLPPTAAVADDPNRVVSVEVEPAPRVDALPEDVLSTPAPAATPAATPAPTPAPAPATPPPGAAPSAAPGNRYVVNLGTYANASNASALVASLKAAGLAAYAEATQVEGKPAQRVRLGPYAQRGEAEAARLKASRLRTDVTASVVALDDAEAARTPAPARAPVAAGFAVQIGALTSEADANALRDRARGAGFTAYVERATTEAGTLWRVRVGPELQRANAERLRSEIASRLRVDGVIVTHP
jgi:DedD protein